MLLRCALLLCCSVSLQAMEEINQYVQFWQRHIDILQCQEALLHESLGNKGYDSSSISAYDSKLLAWTTEEPDKVVETIDAYVHS